MTRLFAVLVACCLFSPVRADEKPVDPMAGEFFEKKIRPILIEHCYECHSATSKKLKGGLRLDSRAALLEGGDLGPAIVPGQPEKSRLIVALTYKDADLQMPKSSKLPDAVITDFRTWVKDGANWPGSAEVQKPKTGGFDLAQRKTQHWSWAPIRPQVPPVVKDKVWGTAPVDQFILAKLEAKQLQPAAVAEPRTVLRRLYFDLIGLPPKPAEVEAFVKEYDPAQPLPALEKVVDRLLQSPQFGERWARHWLDLTRYAESHGHEFDPAIPNAYQYRDYVIRAINADVPYNQFVMEQIAGDLLAQPRLNPQEKFNESILGTGFWFLGEEVHSPVDIRGDEADRFDNRIDVMTKTFLGLTVSCARCHDHKFDAISTKDYYALYGFLRSANYRLVRFDSLETNKEIARKLDRLRADQRGGLQKALADTLQPRLVELKPYLLAGREALLLDPESRKKLATERNLDPLLLEAWMVHLQKAAKDTNDPFHAWALVGKDLEAVARLQTSAKRLPKTPELPKDAEVITDYRNLKPHDWMPDDATFGSGPVLAGEPRFSSDSAKPIASFVEQAAAEKEPIWNGLKTTPGTEREHGSLGGIVRAGNTLRTPTFPLKTGRVYYWVRGAGRVYAAVDSHTLIAGPLHGNLVSGFDTHGQWQWVGYDLNGYKGQRLHLEFSPGSGDFALGMVIQSNTIPQPLLPRDEFLIALDTSGTIDGLAESYQRLFEQTRDRLATNNLTGKETAGGDARLLNWMLNHPALMLASSKPMTEAASSFVAEQNRLLGGIRKESRLAAAMQDGNAENEHVFIRGSHKALGDVVPRRFLEALAGAQPIPAEHGSGRLELAQQMTDPTMNPFVTRVYVNRVWHHLFGRGIVGSTDNFGKLGELPTHPELLDYLADRFAREGWSTKRLIRELVLTRTYRMASKGDPKADAADPENLLLHKVRLRRLEGEAIRDAMLAVSGRLDEKMYGPSVPLFLTSFLEGRGRPASGPMDGNGRRSIYIAVRRNFLSPFFLAFDTPSPFSTVGRRTVSNVPAQALILMNDPFVHQQAEIWGKQMATARGSTTERIDAMFATAIGRPPLETERDRALAFLESQAKSSGKPLNDPSVWTELAHVLFNVKEFIYLP